VNFQAICRQYDVADFDGEAQVGQADGAEDEALYGTATFKRWLIPTIAVGLDTNARNFIVLQ
jgi:hypothetical protein